MNKFRTWTLGIIFTLALVGVVINVLQDPSRDSSSSSPPQVQKKENLEGVWITNTKRNGCRPIIASSYEAFRTAYEARIAGNDRLIIELTSKKVIELLGDGREVRVLETKEISFGSLARLDNKSDVDEIWTDFRCLVRKGEHD